MSFDLLAPHYRWIEAVFAGGRLQRCRTMLLDAVRPPRRVLIYGEGNGRFLADFLRRFPGTQVTVVEASAVMIRLARERLCRRQIPHECVTFVQADALTWQPPGAAFDLLVTCFFLDCFDAGQVRQLVPQIARAATADACWLVSDFQIAKAGWERWRSLVMVKLLYVFFRCVTRVSGNGLVGLEPHLRDAGFVCARREEIDHGMLFSSLWDHSAGICA